MKIKIKKWYMYLSFNSSKCWILDTSNLDVNEDELTMCINEQIYGDKLK